MVDSQGEIYKYISIVFRKRYIFIFVVLSIITSITIYGYFIPKKYQADCTVFIEQSIIDDLVKGIAVSTDIDDIVRVLKYALLSRELISKVLYNLGYLKLGEEESNLQGLIESIKKRTKIKINRGDLFIVSILDEDPFFAQKFINNLVSTYIDENIYSKREQTYGANRFLEGQLDIFRGKLDKAENAIIDFRRKKGVYFSLDEESELKEIKEFLREIEKNKFAINMEKARKIRLYNQLETISPTVDVYSKAGKDNKEFEMGKKLRTLELTYTDNYPEIIRLKSEIKNLQKSNVTLNINNVTKTLTSVNPLYQKLKQQIFDVETKVSSLEAKNINLNVVVAQREKNLHDVPTSKKELGMLVQERNSYRQIYQELLRRMGQSEVTKQIEIGDKADTFRIVDPAVFPESSVSPNMVRILLMAIIAGLGGGFAVVLLLDKFDSTVRDTRQLEGMGITVLASIPCIVDGKKQILTKRRDVLVYGLSGVFFSGFLLLVFYEWMNRFHQ